MGAAESPGTRTVFVGTNAVEWIEGSAVRRIVAPCSAGGVATRFKIRRVGLECRPVVILKRPHRSRIKQWTGEGDRQWMNQLVHRRSGAGPGPMVQIGRAIEIEVIGGASTNLNPRR